MKTTTFEHKVAAITGAASGIGRALALELASRGAHLALCDLDEEGLAETARMLQVHRGCTVTTEVLDVSDRDAVEAWAGSVAAHHGRVNLVFNNAGVAHVGTVMDTPIEDLQWLMGINFWGVVYGTKAFLPHLMETGDGHVVNISSIFGIIGIPNQSAYNAAKFAVRGYTEALRLELDALARGVSATSVHPGGIATNIARSSRLTEHFAARKLALDTSFDKLARTSPQRAATVILSAVRRDARRVLVGPDAYAIDALQRFAPAAYQMLVGRFASRRFAAK